ncbi:MAG: hypothetical protein Ct9H90mP4_05680 [Gammaproteobacteria bacterium]|nr:MAG: hypothetical protein Ct9H90mP4_05680 [Gammaproteobacteria bacterium]
MIDLTLKDGVEKTLVEMVPEITSSWMPQIIVTEKMHIINRN